MVRYVADDRSENAIRHAFDMRLPRWEPGSSHWLCLVMREKSRGQSVGVTGLIDRSDGVAEVGFLLASAFLLEMAPTPSRQEAGYTTGTARLYVTPPMTMNRRNRRTRLVVAVARCTRTHKTDSGVTTHSARNSPSCCPISAASAHPLRVK